MVVDPEDIRARKFPEGFALPTLTKQLTAAAMTAFEEVIPRPLNLHDDEEVAKKAGLGGRVGSGTMLIAYVDELLTRAFGNRWYRTGKVRLYILRPLLENDVLTFTATVRARLPEGDGTRVVFDVQGLNQNGTVTAAGSASVVVP